MREWAVTRLERELEKRDAVVRDVEVAAFVDLLASISMVEIGRKVFSFVERGWDGR